MERLRKMPEDRLLLETDSPHLSPVQGLWVSSPAYIGKAAELLAGYLDVSPEKVFRASVENARDLYRM